MKPRLPSVTPDARTVLPGREVTYHELPSKKFAIKPRAVPTKPDTTHDATHDVRGPGHDMRLIVINVLTGVRARWGRLSVTDKRKIVAHLRSVADLIEKAIGGDAP